MAHVFMCANPLIGRGEGVIPDPGNRTREFQRINFRAEAGFGKKGIIRIIDCLHGACLSEF